MDFWTITLELGVNEAMLSEFWGEIITNLDYTA